MKKLIIGICISLCCLSLAACSDGSTTMDGGKDTDGRAGETTHKTDMVNNPTSGENGEGAQGATENMTGGAGKAIKNTKDAARDVVNGAGQAVRDVGNGVGDAVKNVTDGISGAVDHATGKNK